MSADEYHRAVPQLQHAASMDPTFFFAPYYLGLAYSLQGRYEAAIGEFRKAEQIEPNAQVAGQLGFLYGVTGRRNQAVARLRRLEARSQKDYVSPYLISLVHAGLDEQDLALGWFARAIRERSASLLWPGAKLISRHLRVGTRLARLLDASGIPR
ncbi:MAG: tetratricopeptide repeat protein [Luteitalea sp.]|nr:tetratricopeptide repeat protein [Luteitalea sp.]